MFFAITIEDLLLLLVSLNAAILSILLWVNARKHPSCLWLGWLVFSLGINLLNYQVFARLYYMMPEFTLPRIPTVFVLGPLVYLYVRSLYANPLSFRKKKWLLLPAVLDVAYVLAKALWIYAFDLKMREAYFDGERYPRVQIEFLIHDGLAILFTGWMIWEAYKWVMKKGHNLKSETGIRRLNPGWLRIFLILMGVHAIVWAGFHAVEIYLFPDLLYVYAYFPLHLGLAFLILWMGFRGLMHPEKLEGTFEKSKYQSSGLSEHHQRDLADLIKAKMEGEGLFLNPELRLSDVSEATGLPTHVISQVLSEELSTNFYQFTNSYRIKQVKKELEADESLDKTLLGIGLDAGFNSKNTFYRVFKEHTGLTPSAYRAKVKKGEAK